MTVMTENSRNEKNLENKNNNTSLSSWLVLPGWSFNYKEARKLSAMKWREYLFSFFTVS